MSSWAFWAGFLSNASEIHVNAPPIHPLMTEGNYIYHHEKAKLFFGRYNSSTGDIDYAYTAPPPTHAPTSAPTVAINSTDTNTTNASAVRERKRHLRYSPVNIPKTMSEHVDTLYKEWMKDYLYRKGHTYRQSELDTIDDILFSMITEGRFTPTRV